MAGNKYIEAFRARRAPAAVPVAAPEPPAGDPAPRKRRRKETPHPDASEISLEDLERLTAPDTTHAPAED